VKKLTPYLGASGMGFLAAGVLLRLLQPGRDRVWASFLIAGLALFVLYLVNHWQEVLRLMGRRSSREGANALALAFRARSSSERPGSSSKYCIACPLPFSGRTHPVGSLLAGPDAVPTVGFRRASLLPKREAGK